MPNVLLPMDMHNTYRLCDDTQQHLPRWNNCKVAPFMVPLISELSRKHPTWQFISRNIGEHQGDDRYTAARFEIVDCGDELGYIDRGHKYVKGNYTEHYEFDNYRLKSKRSRGHTTSTVNMSRAIKLINENFYGPTMSERVETLMSRVGSKATSVANNKVSAFDHAYRSMMPIVLDYLRNHWEEFSAVPLEPSLDTLRDEFLDRAGARTEAMAVHISSKAGAGTHVLITGNQYLLARMVNGDRVPLGMFTTDTLPPHIKAGVGILKLAQDEMVIGGVGLRVDEHTYYIMDKWGLSDG